MKTKDERGHRLPLADPDPPEIERFYFREGDFLIFEALDRHKFLPSHYLLEFQRPKRKARMHTLNRFAALRRGSIEQGKILYAPQRQRAQEYARARHLVYGITPWTRRLLEARGTACPVPPTGSAWFVHQLMQGCVSASFELTAPSVGLRYVSRSELLTSDRCGNARAAKNPMAIPLPGYESRTGKDRRTIMPDDLFALENAEGKKRYCILEVDRDTESMAPDEDAERSTAKEERTTYFDSKLRHYHELYDRSAFKAWFGFASPRVLIVTSNESRERQIMRALRAMPNQGIAANFFVTHVQYFDTNWRVPPIILEDLVKEPWQTVAGPKAIAER